MSELHELLKELESGELVRRAALRIEDVDRLLDDRDREPFSLRWMEAHRFVESRKAETELPADDHAIVSRLREAAFQQAFGCRKSSDLADYLSDDFGLIGDSLAFCVDHPFVAELLQIYRNGRVPGDDAA